MKILIVDDIFANRLLLTEIIKDLGHECMEAANGKEAVEMLEDNQIDAILMDIEMPVMNGVEAVKHIRAQMIAPKQKIPIVALTAHNPSLFFDDFNDVGFSNLLTKPYSIEKITTMINSIEF